MAYLKLEGDKYDAFGRVMATSRSVGESALLPLQAFTYAPCGDLITTHTYTNGTDTITEFYDYDLFGNRIATTDALGNAIYKSYDPFGRVVAEWGATYPVRYAYDTQGRRTSLATTRDGIAWDTTTWAYDAATGLCLSKTYADDSSVTYTYTPDNLPLRTTYASGRWRENTYDTSRRLVAETFGGGTGGAGGPPADTNTFTYDVFGIRLSESNSVSSVTYQRDTYGIYTNETITVAGELQSSAAAETHSIDREFDAHSRLVRHGDTYYTYAPDGLLATISNAEAIVEYAYTSDRLDAGYTLTLTNGTVFTRTVVRDTYRRSLVTAITNSVNGVPVEILSYAYDALGRPIARCLGAGGSPAVTETFGYNDRSEVVFSRGDAENAEDSYSYDNIGNLVNHVSNGATNSYTANSLNQYTLRASAPPREFTYDSDGNLLSDGVFTYAYDAANRLSSVTSNGVLLVTNFYDAQSRRVEKVAADGTHRFFYDGWLLVREALTTNNYQLTTDYVWGKDISGTRGGAAGIGGLLYVRRDGAIYVPRFDAFGNVRGYCDAQGSVVAEYTYDAFGNTIAQSGPMADDFALRFSTKYFASEANLYYYGYRYYHPLLMRWLNRDPIGERGGENLYAFCKNNAIRRMDKDGRSSVSFEMWTGNDPAPDNAQPGIFLFIKATYNGQLPKGSTLNFIQIMRGESQNQWELDYNADWPYYITPKDVKEKFEGYDSEGRYTLTFGDGPRGAHSESTHFITSVVEIKRRCHHDNTAFKSLTCVDKVKVLDSRKWTFDYKDSSFKYKNVSEGSETMRQELRKLVENKLWSIPMLCPTRLEIE